MTMIETIFAGLLVGVLVLVLWALMRWVGPTVLRMIGWMIGWMIRSWKNRRYEKERYLNEWVVTTTGYNRHRDCVQDGETIDEGKAYDIPLSSCVCGGDVRKPRTRSGI